MSEQPDSPTLLRHEEKKESRNWEKGRPRGMLHCRRRPTSYRAQRCSGPMV